VRTKILDTLVEIPGDTASDAGSIPAASTKSILYPSINGSDLLAALSPRSRKLVDRHVI